jgi:hypothetical protein
MVSFEQSTGQAEGAYWELAQVQLTVGAVALPWVPVDLAAELQRCQRFFEKSYDLAVAPGTSLTNGASGGIVETKLAAGTDSGMGLSPSVLFKTRKRVTPSIMAYAENGVAGQATVSRATNVPTGLGLNGETGFLLISTSSWGEAGTETTYHWTADAELY